MLFDTKTADDFYALLARLYGTTYGAQSEESVFQRQLRSWAVLLATGRSEIDRAFRQAFPDMSDALIAEWERAFRLPNDSARTLAQRQARVAAHERTNRGATREAVQDTLDATGHYAMFSANRRLEVEQTASEDAAIFQCLVQLAGEDFFHPIVRESIEILFRNSMPAKNIGALDNLEASASSVVEVGARWNSTHHYLDRDAIARPVALTREVYGQRARVKSFGPGSRIDARDLNRIQETIYGSALDGEDDLTSYSGAAVGLLTFWWGADLADGVPVLLDDSMDWRDRLMWTHFQFSRDDGATRLAITPGQADDDAWGNDSNGGLGAEDVSQSVNVISLYTGTGSAASPTYRGFSSNSTPRIVLYSDTTGDLYALADGDDFHACGILWVTPDLGKR